MASEIKTSAAEWISRLNMQPHPEGGFYAEVYRSDLKVSRSEGNADKTYSALTSIFYLIEGDQYSGFHRIKSDEIWYFHKGSPLHIHMIDGNGVYSVQELSDGPDGSLSYTVKAELWFASEIPSKQDYVLVSCAVAPGFEFSEFEMAKKAELIGEFPQHTEILSRLCCD